MLQPPGMPLTYFNVGGGGGGGGSEWFFWAWNFGQKWFFWVYERRRDFGGCKEKRRDFLGLQMKDYGIFLGMLKK